MKNTGASVRLVVDGEDITEVSALDYSSDVLALPDSCNVTISPREITKYRDRLKVGQTATLYTSHPTVNGAAPAARFAGFITDRTVTGNPRGVDFKLTIQDRGVTLQGCAPLWFNLKKGTYADLFEVGKFLEKSFGFKGVRFDNDINRRLKLGMAGFAAEGGAPQGQKLYTPISRVQIEPGDTYLDKLTEFGRRLNLLVGVSVDGYLQAWLPNYQRAPAYKIRLSNRSDSNVMGFEYTTSLDGVYTEAICVGEAVGTPLLSSTDPNAQKRRGTAVRKDALPFTRRLSFADGEMQTSDVAKKMAEWRLKRELFDSWFVRYEVPDWYQMTGSGQGMWWEADQMVEVDDDVNDIHGVYYVSAVNSVTAKDKGDTSLLTVRMKDLLSASFGEIPNPKSYAPPKAKAKGPE